MIVYYIPRPVLKSKPHAIRFFVLLLIHIYKQCRINTIYKRTQKPEQAW